MLCRQYYQVSNQYLLLFQKAALTFSNTEIDTTRLRTRGPHGHLGDTSSIAQDMTGDQEWGLDGDIMTFITANWPFSSTPQLVISVIFFVPMCKCFTMHPRQKIRFGNHIEMQCQNPQVLYNQSCFKVTKRYAQLWTFSSSYPSLSDFRANSIVSWACANLRNNQGPIMLQTRNIW